LARRMCRAGETAEARLRYGFEWVLSREPSGAEEKELKALVASVREIFVADPKRAAAMAGTTGTPGDAAGGKEKAPDAVELASWTTVANVLLNLDETLMKR